ncbi:decapping nuclease DXO homolog isoform X1 [Zeugodacus cucurbitae]|uniref:decapping nuclease DXO homolog isoform X1 n=2 Tax=Zeugodacus cucurbitae TaxID=28588 RepID=UPI0023D93CB0|nr:decapping nuclease DXO homolog isoform X1 [Zeugodacus cucurbitae]
MSSWALSTSKREEFRIILSMEPSATSYPLNLNEGFDQFIFRRNIKERLNKIEKYVMDTEDNVLRPYSNAPSASGQTQYNSKRKLILCKRGVLTDIMGIPYQGKASEYNNATFYVTKYCGVFHMKDADANAMPEFDKKNTYHRKFMQLCFSDDPDSEPTTNIPIDDNNIIFCIIKSLLKEFDLIYSAEVQGIVSDRKIENTHNTEEINDLRFILTKQLQISDKYKGNILSKSKCLRWWLQAYLSKTSDICIGLRDRKGIVRTPVQIKRAEDLVKNWRWKPHVCIRFLYSILKLIEKTMMQVDCPYTVYEFVYDSFAGCFKYKVHAGKSNHSFLSDDYIKKCKKCTSH